MGALPASIMHFLSAMKFATLASLAVAHPIPERQPDAHQQNPAAVGKWILKGLNVGPELGGYPLSKMGDDEVTLSISASREDTFTFYAQVVNKVTLEEVVSTQNDVFAPFDAFDIGTVVVTTRMQGPPEKMEVETEIVKGFKDVKKWIVIDGQQLILNGPTCEMIFDRHIDEVPHPAPGDWILTDMFIGACESSLCSKEQDHDLKYLFKEKMPHTPISLNVAETSEITSKGGVEATFHLGTTVVNRLGMDVTVAALDTELSPWVRLEASDVVSTRMMGPPDSMEVEAEIVKALQSIDRWIFALAPDSHPVAMVLKGHEVQMFFDRRRD